jgi:hypothetical protein
VIVSGKTMSISSTMLFVEEEIIYEKDAFRRGIYDFI